MELSGGHWIWSASLRYFFTVPFLLGIVCMRHNVRPLLEEMRNNPRVWLLWSTVGFGFFYAPICFAASHGAAWLVAGTWQVTIVAGILLVPSKIPVKELATSLCILIGVVFIQMQEAGDTSLGQLLASFLPVIIAAFAYPLGNRKMMAHCQGSLDVYQRILGMTIASLPFWLLLSAYGAAAVGLPGINQIEQSFLVAIFSGIIATVLFFYATDLTKGNLKQLAAVEATQAGEVVFTVLGEMLFLASPLPAGWSLAGMIIIMIGMILHSIRA